MQVVSERTAQYTNLIYFQHRRLPETLLCETQCVCAYVYLCIPEVNGIRHEVHTVHRRCSGHPLDSLLHVKIQKYT